MSITELGTPSVSPTHTISLLQFAQLHHDEGFHAIKPTIWTRVITWAGALESINRHEYHAMADQQKGWLGERQLRIEYPVSDKYTSLPSFSGWKWKTSLSVRRGILCEVGTQLIFRGYYLPYLSSFTHHLRASMVANTFGIHSTWSFQWLWETPHPKDFTQGPLSSVIQCENTIHHFSFTEGRSV